jgi:2-methylcitrate dehydratase PrpD
VTRAVAKGIRDGGASAAQEETRRWAALHILDTVSAMVSGTTIHAGQEIVTYAELLGRTYHGDTPVAGTGVLLDPLLAARVNGMLAHADETDDSHQASLSHPGCAVVPAAMSAARRAGCSGSAFLESVIAGYELTARLNLSLGSGFRDTRGSRPSSHAIGGLFGAAAASSYLLCDGVDEIEDALAYAAQLAAGVNAWLRDTQHVLKAFVFGGMPASNGFTAASLVADGLPGMKAVFDGDPGFLRVLSADPDTHQLTRPWRAPFAIEETNFKRYSVGSPAQAPVEAAERLAGQLAGREVESIRIFLPPETVHVVEREGSPNLNVRYLVAVTLLNGRLTFASAHDEGALEDPAAQGLMRRARVLPLEELAGDRGGVLELTLASGETMSCRVDRALGTAGAPLSEAAVLEKAEDLLSPTLGGDGATAVIDAALGLDRAESCDAFLQSLRCLG